ncbi:ABC transporter ATP-binding protein [soil metagenome]
MTNLTMGTTTEAPQRSSLGLDIRDVSYEYRSGRTRTPAVQDVSLDLAPGQVGVLLGPSGCGKSTLLRMAAGLIDPTAGTITYSGTSTHQLRSERRIGFAFQDPSLLSWRSVRKNIELPFDLAGLPKDPAWVDHLLAITSLTDWAKHRPRQLSGGMRQRVSVARALATKPWALLLDEPFGALDELTRAQLNFELLNILDDTGTTCLMVTHSVEEAVLLGDRVMVLSPRPCTPRAVHDVEVPRTDRRSFRDSPPFAELCARIRASLELS